jgi:TRAP-type C4-dicarboxylate transport system substrate-binding protein
MEEKNERLLGARNTSVDSQEILGIDQTLNIWEGIMKKRFLAFIVSVFCFLGLFIGSSFAADSVAKLEFANFLPSNNPLGAMLEEYSKEIEKRTNGRIKITVHPGGTLTPAPQTYDSIIRGIADMGFASLDLTVGRFPLMESLNLPYGVKDAVMMTKLSNAFYNKFKPKELDEVHILFLLTHGPGIVHTKKPVRQLEDLKGLKLRCPGGYIVRMVQALGAVPVVMPMSEVYDSLSKGVVDGIVATPDALKFFKFGEVVQYTTNNYRTAYESTGFCGMNKKKWNSLPPDVQKIVMQVSEEYAGKLAKLWDSMDQESIKESGAKKHTFITLGKEEEERWRQRIQPLYDEFIKEKTAKGLPAADAIKFCQDWAKANQK